MEFREPVNTHDLVGHVKRLAAEAPAQRSQYLAGIVGALAAVAAGGKLACAAGDPEHSLSCYGEVLAATAQAALLCVLFHWLHPYGVALARRAASVSAYAVLLDALAQHTQVVLAALASILFRVYHVRDESTTTILWRCNLAAVAFPTLWAAQWLMECFYCTRLLKQYCEDDVAQNSWERAVLKRLASGKADKDPETELPEAVVKGAGPFEFDLQCAGLIQTERHSVMAWQKGDEEAKETIRDQEEEDARSLFTKLVHPAPSDPTPVLKPDHLKHMLAPDDIRRLVNWLQEDCKTVALTETVFVDRVMETRENTRDLLGSIFSYASIVALFRTVVECVTYSLAFIAGLIIFVPEGLTSLGPISTGLAGFMLIFGSLIREIGECLVLILVIRPFDIDDCVVVSGKRLIVVEITMLTTRFLNSNGEVVRIRNAHIFADKDGVVNLSHSKNLECGVEIDLLAADSTPEVLGNLEDFVQQYCANQEDSWVPGQCGKATVIAGGCSGILVQMLEPGIVRWRFRVVHRLNFDHVGKVRRDCSVLLTCLLEHATRTLGLKLGKAQRVVQSAEAPPVLVGKGSAG